jgi:prepilin-type N-terminal cleavage/methylation domain-containing protein
MTRRFSSHTSGFTLVELMAAMAVGAIVLLMAAEMLGRTGADYGRISGGVGTERETRAALGQIQSDAAMAVPATGQIFDTRSQQGDWPSHRLGFLCLQPPEAQSDDGRIGDLCAVHYYLKDLKVGNQTVRCLMRGFCESAEAFSALRSGGNLRTLFTETERDEPIAFGVLGFEAWPMKRDTKGNWLPWESPKKSGNAGNANAAGTAPSTPDALRLRLVLATRETMGKLRTPDDWDGHGPTSHLLGTPSKANTNPNLRLAERLVPFRR